MGQQGLATILRRVFWLLNKVFMVPMFRLGLGALVGNPLTGYIMVLKTVGRRTGKVRYTPVNYAILNGKVYCLAGFGRISDWYRNLQANPKVELILPGRALAGMAQEVEDAGEQMRALRQVMKNAGLPGLVYGVSPSKASDEVLREKAGGTRCLCITPYGMGSGAFDAGGWFWITLLVLTLGVLLILFW